MSQDKDNDNIVWWSTFVLEIVYFFTFHFTFKIAKSKMLLQLFYDILNIDK